MSGEPLESRSRAGDAPGHPTISRAASGRRTAKDEWCSEQARRIQDSRRGWLVMWSVWHRTFTAFGCFSPDRLIIDESTVDELAEQMLRVELHYSATSP